MRRSWVPSFSEGALRLASALVFLTLLGCGILEPRLPFDLPEENLSTDPADLRPGDFVWECERWWRGRPAADEIMVDVLFFPQVYPPPDVPHPTAKQRGLVERLGGVIVRPFDFAGLRVWMRTDSVLKLAEMRRDSLYPIQLYSVPDARRYDLYVSVVFASDTDFRSGRAPVHGARRGADPARSPQRSCPDSTRPVNPGGPAASGRGLGIPVLLDSRLLRIRGGGAPQGNC
jgi:hypothetical protein